MTQTWLAAKIKLINSRKKSAVKEPFTKLQRSAVEKHPMMKRNKAVAIEWFMSSQRINAVAKKSSQLTMKAVRYAKVLISYMTMLYLVYTLVISSILFARASKRAVSSLLNVYMYSNKYVCSFVLELTFHRK